MNKIIAWLPALMIAAIIAYKPVKETTKADFVNRNIEVAVFKGSDYTSEVYDNASAQVHIVVKKVNNRGHYTIVWNKVLDSISLSKYPSIQSAIKQSVTVHGINEKKEYLVVDYTLTYSSKGNQLQMHNATVVIDNQSGQVEISI
jgi:hypothetical protein